MSSRSSICSICYSANTYDIGWKRDEAWVVLPIRGINIHQQCMCPLLQLLLLSSTLPASELMLERLLHCSLHSGYSVGDFRGWCSVQTSFWSSWPCLISLTCFSLLPSFSSFCLSPNHQSQNVVSISSTISISSYTFFPSFKSQPHKHTFLLSFIIIIILIITHLNPFRKYT